MTKERFHLKAFVNNSETREFGYVKEKRKADSMVNYTSTNFNIISNVS